MTARRPAATDAGMPEPERPSRPILVELASAILVVGGLMSVLSSTDVVMRLSTQGEAVDTLALLSLAIGVAGIVLGILIRFARGWLVALNLVAIAAFLELTSASIVGLVFGSLDLFVVLVLLFEQSWFRWRPPADDR